MSSFRFRLQRVLALREIELSIEESALARLRLELTRLEDELRDIHLKRDKEAEVLQAARLVAGSEIAGFASVRTWARQEEMRLQTSLAACHRSIELRKASLMEAQRKMRLLQRLREYREAAWTCEQNRALDELAGESAVALWRRDADRQPAKS